MSENVPLNIQKAMEELAPKLGIEMPQLNSEFLAFLADVRTSKPNLDEGKQMERAYILLKGNYRRKRGTIPTKAVFFKGVFIGATDLVDFNEFARMKAAKLFREDPQKAVNEQWTDENGTPLDRREEVFKRANKNYLKPIEGHSYQRTWYGIGSEIDPTVWKFFSLRWYAIEIQAPPKFSVPVKFQAIKKKEDATTLLLNASKSASVKFEELTMPDFNIEEAVRQVAPLVSFGQLQTWHEEHKKDRTAIVMVEGDVDNLWLEPHPQTGSRKLVLRDTALDSELTDGMSVFVPDWVNIDFGEDSRVFVLGRTSMSKPSDEYPQGKLQMNAFGVLPLPEFRTTPEQVSQNQQKTLEIEWVQQ